MKTFVYILCGILWWLTVFLSSQALDIDVTSDKQQNRWYNTDIRGIFWFPENSFTKFEWIYPSGLATCVANDISRPDCGLWKRTKLASDCQDEDGNSYDFEACTANIAPISGQTLGPNGAPVQQSTCDLGECVGPICPANSWWRERIDEENGVRKPYCSFTHSPAVDTRNGCPSWWGMYRYYSSTVATECSASTCSGRSKCMTDEHSTFMYKKTETCKYNKRNLPSCSSSRTCYARVSEIGCITNNKIPECGPSNDFTSNSPLVCNNGTLIEVPGTRVYEWTRPSKEEHYGRNWNDNHAFYEYYEHNGVRYGQSQLVDLPIPPLVRWRILNAQWSCKIDLFNVECKPYIYTAPVEILK